MTTLFIDASAIVAMMTGEHDGEDLVRAMSGYDERLSSPIAIWEAVVAVARKRVVPLSQAEASLDDLLKRFGVRLVSIGGQEGHGAVAAWDRYGKGARHKAALNMGDCFAYACSKTNNARLLYKGDDFVHTDLG